MKLISLCSFINLAESTKKDKRFTCLTDYKRFLQLNLPCGSIGMAHPHGQHKGNLLNTSLWEFPSLDRFCSACMNWIIFHFHAFMVQCRIHVNMTNRHIGSSDEFESNYLLVKIITCTTLMVASPYSSRLARFITHVIVNRLKSCDIGAYV